MALLFSIWMGIDDGWTPGEQDRIHWNQTDGIGIFGAGTLLVGIVEAQDEPSTGCTRERPVEQCCTKVADMQIACR